MSYENVLFEVKDTIGYITLNRPPMNPINLALLLDMQGVIEEIKGNKDIRVVILTGSGDKAFAAGADIKAMVQMNPEEIKPFGIAGQKVMQELENLHVPVIAAVNGFALGGGTELAISCDFIVASDRAMFGQPEVKLGIIPGFGGTQRLPRLIGRNMAKELIYRGNIIKADEALRIGLVNHVVPHEELMPAVEKIAKEIAGVGPLAVTASKKAINTGYHKELDDGNEIEVNEFFGTFATEDRIEGMTKFLAKEVADFKGK